MSKRLIFLGPPGAGKGSQADITKVQLGIPSISTGSIFREAMAQDSAMGKQIAQFVNAGLLVPDKLTNAIVSERLEHKDATKGFILDGYPRSLVQAKALDTYLAKTKKPIDHVLYFSVDVPLVVDRMGKRRICSQCGQTYHVVNHPPKSSGVCDKCRGSVVMRADDQPESIRKRLAVYEDTTAPLLQYYQKKGLLIRVDASGSVAEVDMRVNTLLGLTR